jgi:hypothetical protein
VLDSALTIAPSDFACAAELDARPRFDGGKVIIPEVQAALATPQAGSPAAGFDHTAGGLHCVGRGQACSVFPPRIGPMPIHSHDRQWPICRAFGADEPRLFLPPL